MSFKSPVNTPWHGDPQKNVENALNSEKPPNLSKNQEGIETQKVPDSVVPQTLEEEMNREKVLFWSSNADEGPTPLTDDEALNQTPIELPGESILPPPEIPGVTQ